MMHGKLPAHTITACLDVFSAARKGKGGQKKGREMKASGVA